MSDRLYFDGYADPDRLDDPVFRARNMRLGEYQLLHRDRNALPYQVPPRIRGDAGGRLWQYPIGESAAEPGVPVSRDRVVFDGGGLYVGVLHHVRNRLYTWGVTVKPIDWMVQVPGTWWSLAGLAGHRVASGRLGGGERENNRSGGWLGLIRETFFAAD
ncbi:Chk1 protein kinase [Hypoxylon texense]